MKKNKSTQKLEVFTTSVSVYNMAKLRKETEEIRQSARQATGMMCTQSIMQRTIASAQAHTGTHRNARRQAHKESNPRFQAGR